MLLEIKSSRCNARAILCLDAFLCIGLQGKSLCFTGGSVYVLVRFSLCRGITFFLMFLIHKQQADNTMLSEGSMGHGCLL